MLANKGELLDYLEIICGRGKALAQESAPFIAIPTTAGTGAEVTRNAVIASPEHRVKVSLRSPSNVAKVALVDPELTFDLPPHITASTGLDALTQLIEPYVCLRANPMTDALCREGVAPRRAIAAARISGWSRPGRTREHVRRKLVQRAGTGQCRTRCSARIRRSDRRSFSSTARCGLRGASAARDGRQLASLAARCRGNGSNSQIHRRGPLADPGTKMQLRTMASAGSRTWSTNCAYRDSGATALRRNTQPISRPPPRARAA